MAESLDQIIRRVAGDRCEYCRVPDGLTRMRHILDHVIAAQHRGKTAIGNLALCCPPCNLYKGPNIAGIDPETGLLTRLFHPRTDQWGEHFKYQELILSGVTDVGRTTVEVLAVNLPLRIATRQSLRQIGLF